MDPVTAAILAALGSGALKAAGKVGEDAVSAAYAGLKALLRRRFGDDHQVVSTVEDAEAHPDSKARQAMVEEVLQENRAADDAELVAAAQALLAAVRELPGGDRSVATVTGSSNVAVAQQGGHASVTVHGPGTP